MRIVSPGRVIAVLRIIAIRIAIWISMIVRAITVLVSRLVVALAWPLIVPTIVRSRVTMMVAIVPSGSNVPADAISFASIQRTSAMILQLGALVLKRHWTLRRRHLHPHTPIHDAPRGHVVVTMTTAKH